MSGKLAITLKRSTIGSPDAMRATVRGLGLRKLHQTVIQPDNPSTRGAAFKIRHLIDICEYIEGNEPLKKAPSARQISITPSPVVEAAPIIDEAQPTLDVAAPVVEAVAPTSDDAIASNATDQSDQSDDDEERN